MILWFTCIVTHWFTPPPPHKWDFCLQEKLLWKSSSWASSFSKIQVKRNIKQQQGVFFCFLVEPQALKPILMLTITRLHIIPAVTWKGFSACSEGKRKGEKKPKKPSTSPKSQIFKMLNNSNSERLFQAKAVRLRIYKPDCSTLVAKQNCLHLSLHSNIAVKL